MKKRYSILQDKKQCIVCNKTFNLNTHEVYFGNKNRDKSIEDGCCVYLCKEHHQGTNGVHGKNGHELDLYLKQEMQKQWIKIYNKSIDDFIKRYGKNYF